MPIIKSAKKRVKQTQKATVRNAKTKRSLRSALKAFVKKFGDKYRDEDIIEATKRYINSFNGDYRFMQLLKYFILKRVIVEGEIEETSQLLSYLSNSNEDERQDWTSMLS